TVLLGIDNNMAAPVIIAPLAIMACFKFFFLNKLTQNKTATGTSATQPLLVSEATDEYRPASMPIRRESRHAWWRLLGPEKHGTPAAQRIPIMSAKFPNGTALVTNPVAR